MTHVLYAERILVKKNLKSKKWEVRDQNDRLSDLLQALKRGTFELWVSTDGSLISASSVPIGGL